LAAAAPAHAERVVLGQASPVAATSLACASCTLIQTALPGSEAVTPPGAGRIDAWWAIGGGTTLAARLRVVHTLPSGQFHAQGTSSPERPTATVTDFPTSLPAAPGDLVGLTITAGVGDHVEIAANNFANINEFTGPFPDGTDQPFVAQSANVLELGAEFVYTPAVTGVQPAAAPTAGGDPVVITGDHLTDSTAVKFGTADATSFHIDSNTQITAVPPAHDAGVVDVTIAGPGGTSATGTADQLAFHTPTGAVSPPTIDFGAVPLAGASRPQTVTLTNAGDVSIAVASDSLGGNADDFTKAADDCSGRRIAPGGACSVQMFFTPIAAGGRRATLSFDDTLPSSPQTVVLTGTTPTAPATPSNSFAIGKLHGTTLTVTLSSKGTVSVAQAAVASGRGVTVAARRKRPRLLKPSSASGGPGTIRVPLRLTAFARRTLKARHRLKVAAKVTFAPDGGTAASQTVNLTVRRTKRR
jgi:large repetitive protein